jgi:Flp pilus assembly protein TadG
MWNPEAMTVSPMQKMSLRVRGLLNDCRGIAAVEFAVIVPIMLVMFFGVVEFSSAIAVYRKATLVARTLSDLTSQMKDSVADADLTSFGQTAKAILTPYAASPLSASITELYVEPGTLSVKVQWSTALSIDSLGNVTLVASAHHKKDVVIIPQTLKISGTYLIWSEVGYTYKPAVGYVMAPAGVPLADFAYTRPRQSLCVDYPAPVAPALPCTPVT